MRGLQKIASVLGTRHEGQTTSGTALCTLRAVDAATTALYAQSTDYDVPPASNGSCDNEPSDLVLLQFAPATSKALTILQPTPEFACQFIGRRVVCREAQ